MFLLLSKDCISHTSDVRTTPGHYLSVGEYSSLNLWFTSYTVYDNSIYQLRWVEFIISYNRYHVLSIPCTGRKRSLVRKQNPQVMEMYFRSYAEWHLNRKLSIASLLIQPIDEQKLMQPPIILWHACYLYSQYLNYSRQCRMPQFLDGKQILFDWILCLVEQQTRYVV